MAEKHAIFIDIDGTLIGGSFRVPKENIDTLRRAQEAGHKVFINTGRSWGNIPEDLRRAISFADGIVCGNGCHLILGGREYYKKFIPVKTLKKIIDYIEDYPEIWCVFEGENELFGKEDLKKTRGDMDEKIPIVSAEHFEKNHADCGIEVVAMGRTLPADFEKVFEGELNVFRLETYADCVAYDCSKAKGMLEAMKWAGVDAAHTIAIGDSENDRSMLEIAGTAVVMGNAPDEIKKIADFVTLSNKEAGVAYAVKHLLFKE
ncbi:MAG: HAD family phosphatase [Clostridia bacterium]|nr:HAD family phosphatase [Clostridia bacterium]